MLWITRGIIACQIVFVIHHKYLKHFSIVNRVSSLVRGTCILSIGARRFKRLDLITYEFQYSADFMVKLVQTNLKPEVDALGRIAHVVDDLIDLRALLLELLFELGSNSVAGLVEL